jgi:hypothetical protein
MILKKLHSQLVHLLVKMDEAAARRERHPNIYRMGLFLKAAQEAEVMAEADVAAGHDATRAFVTAVMANFTPTRRMHTFLKKIDPTVDVKYGGWVRK